METCRYYAMKLMAYYLVESFAGMGEDQDAALLNAINNFSQNSLHVFLAALWECDLEDHVNFDRGVDHLVEIHPVDPVIPGGVHLRRSHHVEKYSLFRRN